MGSNSKLSPKVVEAALKSFKNWRAALSYFHWASNQEGYWHSCYTYNAMADLLSDARQNAPLRKLAESVPNSRCSWTPGALGYFLRCLGRLNLVNEANSLFDEMKSSGHCVLNNYSYNCLLEVIAKSGAVDLLERRLDEMKSFGCPVSKYVLTPVLHCYCNAGELDKAMVVFNQMRAEGWVDQHVLGILVLHYCKAGAVDTAFELVEWGEKSLKINLNEKTFCVLIRGFVRHGRVDKALELYDKMRKIGYMPDLSVFGVLISGLCGNNEVGKAIMLCADMKELRISPNSFIISSVLPCIREEREMVQFLEVCFMNLGAGKRMLLEDLVNDGFADKAYHMLKAAMGSGISENSKLGDIGSMKDKLDIACFQTVIDGLCNAGELDMALDLFSDMDRSGCKRSVLLFNNLILSLSNADRLNDCFQLLNRMKETGFEPTHFTFNCIFGCLCKREDAAGALDLLREMRARGHEPWIKHYTLLVKKLCESGKVSDACKFLADMIEVGFLPDMIAYSAAIDGFINNNELDQSLILFNEICEKGYCPDVVAYNTVIKGLCRAHRITKVIDILKEMLGKELAPSVVTYNLLINLLCKSGDTNNAIHCFSRMKENDHEPNVITYTTLVDGLCNDGKPDDALKIWSEMEDKRCQPNSIAYMALIHGLCKCQKPDVALFYLQKMEEKEMVPDKYVYEALIDSFNSNSNKTMADELSEKMARLSTAS
ncbi:putative pentatricopeptide repeat-containing protein At5g08310, mitochondrial [Andrographis paniculata]|uniref:putative pentatricopeptide repeat-containing protein At5g08310, mitochondrial n=1 Tax=Andrographis paniculata TaxID=175694 RepID=UPI0021E8ADF7|nr:putative pentatricopeptide repeat-containing protein At5g08310, mitochondrial [Andrographis paniculata]XP_051115947.1 putative pentatricopeptide repeat-containing protein At5g08310, mitochondrial [Andrographis paniculata]XP_051115948.1 putative pentatricopeptide repeat-containing protein At5g08310, mitochondrial [Andrographis paniculata]XP_051115949.1 putative pentatricopeptide repeat-containing protein At5g08310, mitochondrial [Andrographis paniculata]XP_051115950.1 putative pentatricopepti